MIHRSMYLLASDNYGKTFQVVTTHPWDIGMCVMSTAALAPKEKGLLASWETQGQIYLLDLMNGEPAKAPVAISGKGQAHTHPSIAVNGRGEYVVAWTEGAGWNKGGSMAWQVFGRDGTPMQGQSGTAAGLPAWDVPAAFSRDDNSFKIAF
jgi:hypothetical protein